MVNPFGLAVTAFSIVTLSAEKMNICFIIINVTAVQKLYREILIFHRNARGSSKREKKPLYMFTSIYSFE